MSGDIKNSPTPSGASSDAAFKVVVIGASAGGIQALGLILSALPYDFRAAIAVVQHRAPRGPSLLARVLGRRSPLTVRDAEHGEPLRPGIVHLAPPGSHLLAEPDGTLSLDHSEKVHGVRPSVEKLGYRPDCC
jgi:two-component system chemotaxis response regulator CheB